MDSLLEDFDFFSSITRAKVLELRGWPGPKEGEGDDRPNLEEDGAVMYVESSGKVHYNPVPDPDIEYLINYVDRLGLLVRV